MIKLFIKKRKKKVAEIAFFQSKEERSECILFSLPKALQGCTHTGFLLLVLKHRKMLLVQKHWLALKLCWAV